VRWLFPGSVVRVEAPCLDCGDPMVIEVQDDKILHTDPDEMVGYTSSMVGGTLESRPFR